MSKMKGLSILLMSLALISNAQEFENIEITTSSRGKLGPCEPSIAIDPANPNRLVAGSVINSYHYSNDGGRSWSHGELKSPFGVWGDPVIVADWTGNFYYFHLSDPTGKNWQSEEMLDRIVCQKSPNGGEDWNDGGYMGLDHPKDQDKPWGIADRKTGNIYCTWTQFDKYGSSNYSKHKSNILFSKSEDEGLSWSEAHVLSEFSGNCLDGDSTTEGSTPCVGPKGEIYVAWSFNEKIYFDRSLDKGEIWMDNDVELADQPMGWNINIRGLNRVNGMPFIGCDISNGKHKGTIYVNWVDHRNGINDPDVFVSRSTDKGLSWSEPVRVNNDEAGNEQFFTNMDVDPVTGYVYVVFYDRRDLKGTETNVYLAVSKDGGKSFENHLISESTFEIKGNVFFGDYNDISAYNGMVRPIWTRLDGRYTSVWTALIQIEEEK